MKALYLDHNFPKLAALSVAKMITRNAVFAFFSPFRCAEVPEPSIPGPRWIKVRNRVCGLCATDVHLIYVDVDPKSYIAAVPGTSRTFLGHEVVSEVVEVGPEVTDFTVGDRVAQRIGVLSCFQMEISPPCRQCQQGNYMLCENPGLRPLPIEDTGGGFSPLMIMHQSQAFHLPPELSDDEAVLVEPVAVAVHGVMKRMPQKSEKVLVLGCGTIGLLTIAVARTFQPTASIYGLSRYDFQAVQAAGMGADNTISERSDYYAEAASITGGRYIRGAFGNRILLGGFDLVYDCIGTAESLNHALRLTRAGGTVVLLGVSMKPGKLDFLPIWYQEVQVLGVSAHGTESTGENSFQIASRLIEEKRIHLDGMITHRFALRDYRHALEAFSSKGKSKAVKIVIDHGPESLH